MTERLVEECRTNYEYQDCIPYSENPSEYMQKMFFAQSVSGMTANFSVNSSRWVSATMPTQNFTSSTASNTEELSFSPALLMSFESESAVEAMQAKTSFAHGYFINLGFGDFSGWTGAMGMDELFSVKAQKLYDWKVRDQYLMSNLVVEKKEANGLSVTFKTSATGNTDGLRVRLLSSEDFSAQVTENDSNEVTVTLNELPTADVYVSLYSDQSKQMATAVLTADDFATSVSGQAALSGLENTFADLVQEHGKVTVHTRDANWVRHFYLPEGVEGHVVEFKSAATFTSHIHYNVDQEDLLTTNTNRIYKFTDGEWTRLK